MSIVARRMAHLPRGFLLHHRHGRKFLVPLRDTRDDNRAMTHRKKVTVAVAVLALSLIGLGLFLLVEQSGSPPSEYDDIAPGMTPQQVRALLGAEPTVASEDGDNRSEIYYLSEMGSSWGQVHVVYRAAK
jgi:hypothetical protein